MENLKISHNLTEEELAKCYITPEGNIIPPRGNLTGEEVYKEWLENKDTEKEQKTEDLLIQEIAELKLEIMQLKEGK